MEGTFHVYDSYDQCVSAVHKDGVPRYALMNTDGLRDLCSPHESVRQGAGLYIRPHPLSPWYYANSSFIPEDAERNTSRRPGPLSSRKHLGVNDAGAFFFILK